jgi:hypothetical protein
MDRRTIVEWEVIFDWLDELAWHEEVHIEELWKCWVHQVEGKT